MFTHLVRLRNLDKHVLGFWVLVLVWMPKKQLQELLLGHTGLIFIVNCITTLANVFNVHY